MVEEHTQTEDNLNPTTIDLGSSDLGPTESIDFTITIAPTKPLISFILFLRLSFFYPSATRSKAVTVKLLSNDFT